MNNQTRFDKLTNIKNGKYKIESIAETKKEIAFIIQEVECKQAVGYFAVGERLTAIKEKLEHGKFLAYLENEFPYSRQTAYNYMRLYEFYKDDPASLGSLGYREALIKAGIIDSKRPDKNTCGKIEYGNPDKQYEFPWEYAFEKPPLSNAKLNNYRIETPGNHDIYLIRRGFNAPIKIVDILLSEPEENANTLYRGMLEDFQRALEKYFFEIERIEALNTPKKG